MFNQQDKITREDLAKIKKSIKDPKFNEIMEDYMLEISDPKNKEEQDKYLLQLEKEGDLPDHLQLIQPRKFFCIQTCIASEVNYNYSQTLYINICLHEEIEESKIKDKNENGANWALPYQIGKQRYDQDILQDNKKSSIKDKKVVTVIDVCFNNNIEYLCNMNQAFKKMVADSAIDGVQKRANERKEKIDKDYKYVSDLQCKGTKPSIMPIQKKQKLKNTKEKSKLYHEIMGMKDKNQIEKKENKNGLIKEVQSIQNTKDQIDEQQYPICPKYKIIHQYETESEDYYESKFKQNKQIKKLKIQIELPKAEKVSNIQCDIDEDWNLILEYQDIYYLNCRINKNINRENYKAKFNKQKKQLVLEFQMIISNQNKEEKLDQQNFIQKNDNIIQENNKQNIKQDDIKQDNLEEDNNQNIQNSKKDLNQKNLDSQQVNQTNNENRQNDDQINDCLNQNDQKENLFVKQTQKIQSKQNKSNNQNQKRQIQDEIENCDQNIQKSQIDFELFNQQKIDNKTFITFKIEQQQNIKVLQEQQDIILFHKDTYNNIVLNFENNDFKMEYKIVKNYATIIIESEKEIKFQIQEQNKQKLKELIDQQKQERQNQISIKQNQQQKNETESEEDEDDQEQQEVENNFDFLLLNLNKEVFNIYQLIKQLCIQYIIYIIFC